MIGTVQGRIALGDMVLAARAASEVSLWIVLTQI